MHLFPRLQYAVRHRASIISTGSNSQRSSEASSIFDLENSEADSLLPDLLNTRTSIDDLDNANESQRRLHRQEALFLVYGQQHEEDIIENRQSPPLPEEHFGHRLLVKCLQLRFVLIFLT